MSQSKSPMDDSRIAVRVKTMTVFYDAITSHVSNVT
jgi:hypothetical protein